MNWLDIIILLPMLVGLVMGIKRGLIIELTGLLAIIAGFVCIRIWGAQATGWLMQQVNWSEAICSVLAHALLFLAVSISLHLIARLLTKLFKTICLGWINRLLGGLFGLVKWSLIILLVVFCIDRLDQQFQILKPEIKQQSVIYQHITPLSEKVWEKVKEQTACFIEEHKDKISQKNEQNQ